MTAEILFGNIYNQLLANSLGVQVAKAKAEWQSADSLEENGADSGEEDSHAGEKAAGIGGKTACAGSKTAGDAQAERDIEEVAEASGKSAAEIKKIVEGKLQKFSGLLDYGGAVFMAARELGVELSGSGRGNNAGGAAGTAVGGQAQLRKIAELKEGAQDFGLDVAVKHIFAPKKFEKDGKKGVLLNMVVEDASGEARLTLWHDDAKKFEAAKIERGAALALRNCYAKEWKGKLQVSLMRGGAFGVSKKSKQLPEVNAEAVKLDSLKGDMSNVDVYAKVLRKFEEKNFEREGKKGAVMNFIIGDETATLRATAWNEMVETVSKLNDGEIVKIEGAYTKNGMRGIELHLGWQARLIEEPQGVSIAEVGGNAAGSAPVQASKISELKDGFSGAISGKIAELQRGNLKYLVCPKCGKKIEQLDEGFVCNSCGSVKEPASRLVLGFVLEDGSGSIRCVMFGDEVEKLAGTGNEKIMEMLGKRPADEVLEIISGGAVGKEVSVSGRAKINDFRGEIEFMCNRVL